MTTKENVIAIAPELSSSSDDLWALVLADVSREVRASSFRSGDLEEAQRYLAAHLLTLASQSNAAAAGPVKSEKMGDASRKYATISDMLGGKATRYDTTAYGRRYQLLRRRNIITARVL